MGIMVEVDPDLIQEGSGIIPELQQHGYHDIILNLAHCAAQFLENLHTLATPLKVMLPSLASLDIPLVRFYNEDVSGTMVAKCIYACSEWGSLLQGLIPSAYNIIDEVNAEVSIKEHLETINGFHTEFYIKPACSSVIEEQHNTNKPDSFKQQDFQGFEDVFTDGIPKFSPATFCRMLPFHMMLDSQLKIVQTGTSLARISKGLILHKDKFTDKFELISPAMAAEFEVMKTWDNIPVIIKYKMQKKQQQQQQHPQKADSTATTTNQQEKQCNSHSYGNSNSSGKLNRCYSHPIKTRVNVKVGELLLRGQITYISESNQLLFLGSPSVQNISELSMQGLFLSDIPLHDSTRDLLLFNEQLKAERDLAKKLENATMKLEETCADLEAEKELSDNLVYSILPSSVAERLHAGQPVEAKKYRLITILFCGICDFDNFCTRLEPMEVVDMLNDIYTRFDALADTKERRVYKMETVGDKYMLVSGLSEKNTLHATDITHAALDMLDIAKRVTDLSVSLKVQIGVHSGEVVAGVVGQKLPHYAMFGGTVCLASRMESMAEPNKINMAEASYKSIVESGCTSQFVFHDRGCMKIKGWSDHVQCFFVERPK